jgi:hypothetical protein
MTPDEAARERQIEQQIEDELRGERKKIKGATQRK